MVTERNTTKKKLSSTAATPFYSDLPLSPTPDDHSPARGSSSPKCWLLLLGIGGVLGLPEGARPAQQEGGSGHQSSEGGRDRAAGVPVMHVHHQDGEEEAQDGDALRRDQLVRCK